MTLGTPLPRDLLRARLDPEPNAAAQRGVVGDHDMNADAPRSETLRPAAVLVPLVDHRDGAGLLLTQRPRHLKAHPGQISFPGGRVEDSDTGPIDAALREAEEEVGLDRRHVEVVGLLDPYETGTGFLIQPVVGVVTPGFRLTLDPGEVDEAFEVPLGFILDPANLDRRGVIWRGALRHYYVFPYQHRYIWGATAGMLVNLTRRLGAEEPMVAAL